MTDFGKDWIFVGGRSVVGGMGGGEGWSWSFGLLAFAFGLFAHGL